MTTTCETVQQMIPDHTWLNREERQMLLAHLEACDSCQQVYETVCEFGALLCEDAQSEMPDDMADRVMVALADESLQEEWSGLSLMIGVVICAQIAVLIGLRTNLLTRLREVHVGWQWLVGDVVQPLFSGCWISVSSALGALSGSAQSLRIPELWLPIAVGALLVCLMSGGVLYGEEKYHG
ncbi:MAG: zf-HC2 domain-containing protein [Lentisphaerae bacterium]|nr:zf-HC2 domain-containing protein [Lentisphaerota bacterium]MBT5610709.1 zf-HC2 domain-containing protein [Lentisphaerota bacterium]MBT7054278.1 zf-HC2 domain-containing protein [Lentisphaerota bacterium]MBT7844339.1 zf-HC2 domain-containing protein [Lentisphaerota bacterium]